jgi:hypothetical protein
MLNFLKPDLERNYVAVMAGKTDERREAIGRHGKSSEFTMLELSEAHPEGVARFLGRQLSEGQRYVGAGSQHTVIQEGGVVTKIHRRSVYRSEKFRQSLREQFVGQHAELHKYLGRQVVPQSTYVGTHPLNPSQRAVLSRQRAIDYEPIRLFSPIMPSIDMTELLRKELTYPGIVVELNALALRALKLCVQTKLLVDSSGPDKIVVDRDAGVGERVILLDALPFTNPQLPDYRRIVEELNMLADATESE